MRGLASAALLAAVLAAGRPASATDGVPPPPVARVDATGYLYVVPQAPDFAMGIASADLRWLHLEGRYNYEALHTGSAFVGLTGRWGRPVQLTLTPMAGAAFGRLDGFVPALRATVTWWRFFLWTEPQVLIRVGGTGQTFFYDWTEVGFALGGLRVGAVAQRTQVFETALAFQRGLFGGISLGPFNATLYAYNWGWLSPTFVAALGLAF